MKIYSQAPCRISLFGGGTDVEPYASTYGGICINIAINLRQKITLYSEDDLYEHPYVTVPYLGKKEFYYAILDEYGINDMHISSVKGEFDGILESGIGSSAAAAVALLGAINTRLNLKMTKHILAEKAWDLEVNKMGLFGGKQDQYAAAFGGANLLQFTRTGVKVSQFDKNSIEALLPALVLFYTGKNRQSAKIQEGFKDLSREQIASLNIIKRIALDAIDPIIKNDIPKIGALLDESWEFKKLSNGGVTNEEIDEIYLKAKELGAYGGKVLGAGGGGYMIFVVHPAERDKFIENMQKEGLEWWDFSPCWNGLETRIL